MSNRMRFSKDICDRILLLIRKGVTPRVAAQSVGIDKTTLYKWISRGAEEKRRREAMAKDHWSDFNGTIAEESVGAEWEDVDRLSKAQFMDKLYLFSIEYSKAEAQAEAALVEHIVETGKGGQLVSERQDAKGNVSRTYSQPDAKPAQWILSRRWRERWGDKMALDVTNEAGEQTKMDLSRLSNEELATFEMLLDRVTVEEEGDNGEHSDEPAE